MSKQLKRQIALIKLLDRAGLEGCNNKKIENHLRQQGYSFSTSTLSKDIATLKASGWSIDDSTKSYYKLVGENKGDFQTYFMKYQFMAYACQKALEYDSTIMNYVFFEPNTLQFNSHVFEEVLSAVINRKKIKFTHINFQKNNQKKTHVFAPYILKEYSNRWYMIGEGDGVLKTFAIARVSNLTILDKKFNAEKGELIDLLNEVVGVSFNKDIKQEFIILKIDNSQKEYIKTTPIHKNQEITEEHKDYFILRLFVGNTIELRQCILQYGCRIEVLEPTTLRKQIFIEIENLYIKYK